MQQLSIPVYQVKTMEDINYRDICNDIPVGGKFMIRYPDNITEDCTRIEDYVIKSDASDGYPEAHIVLDKNYQLLYTTS